METITEDEIRAKLSEHYGGDNSNRDLVVNERLDSHGSVGSIVYSLSGSPPKGYAIAIPELRVVNFYDNHGKRFRILEETTVERPDADECDVCGVDRTDCAEWAWYDSSGATAFRICADCREHVGETDDGCPICGRTDAPQSRSEGFGPMGPQANAYQGCDDCRSMVVFDNTESVTPVWMQ